MLSHEERKLPSRYPKSDNRKNELIAFCKRYNDAECPLSDTEHDLIDGVALDIGREIAPHIIAAVTGKTNYRTYWQENVDICDEDSFYRYIRRFFNILDSRKRKYECRGKYIMDYFEGSVSDTFKEMKAHVDNGWSVMDVSTFCKDNRPYSVAFFQKLEPEEVPT